MADVRYWQVHVTHTTDVGVVQEVVGVVADTEEVARTTCEQRLAHSKVAHVVNVGHVRFIVHNFLESGTKVMLNGEEQEIAVPPKPQ